MRIFFDGDRAFFQLKGDSYICIGSKEEAERADALKLQRMVQESLALGYFMAIEKSRGQTVH